MGNEIIGAARLVHFGAVLPGCKVIYLFAVPPDIHWYRQLHHYNRIILPGIQSAVWEKILIASGV